MKTKYWLALIGLVLLICAGFSAFLLRPGEGATQAQIWSEGELKQTVLLAVDQTLTVEGSNGTNVITVKDGAIAVTEADCPDHYCMERGYCSGGTEIVCLPNRLVIRFLGEQAVDAVAG